MSKELNNQLPSYLVMLHDFEIEAIRILLATVEVDLALRNAGDAMSTSTADQRVHDALDRAREIVTGVPALLAEARRLAHAHHRALTNAAATAPEPGLLGPRLLKLRVLASDLHDEAMLLTATCPAAAAAMTSLQDVLLDSKLIAPLRNRLYGL